MPHLPNSSAKSGAPLHLILEPSRAFGRAIIGIHGLSWFAALAPPLPLWIKAILAATIGLSLYLTLRQHILNPEIQGLTLTPDGRWEIIRRSGPLSATLAHGTVVTRWIVILHLASDSGNIAIPICRDSVDPESFRRLRVHLRVAGGGLQDE
jgi:hypothetical protein